LTIGAIRGSLENDSTPVSCSSIIVLLPRGSLGLAVHSNDLDLGSLQNDVDVLAALDIVKLDLYAEVRRCGGRILTAPTLLTQVPESRPLRREDANRTVEDIDGNASAI
jgi:hypothetical protein